MKRTLLILAAFVLTLGGIGIAANFAEDTKAKAPAAEPLAAEHKVLAKHVGNWSITGSFNDPTGKAITVSGEATIELILGDRFLYEESKTVTADGNACQGRGFMGFNTGDNAYQALFISEKMNGMKVMNGAYDADLKAVVYSGAKVNPETKQSLNVRVEVRFETDDKFVVQFFCSESVDPAIQPSPRDAEPKKPVERKEGELIYTRK
ncbi:MAG: DUF1579 family protein [Planctomycetes bacterium]|nr:DUF1579 family protein [Planctomycetota bacterium]